MMDGYSSSLAERLGVSTPITPLHFEIQHWMERYPSPGALRVEDWLLDVANVRGADYVVRVPPRDPAFQGPSREEFSDEDLVAAICRPSNLDRPPMIRAAAQLISKGRMDVDRLWLALRREKTERVISEIARQAVRIAPLHPLWSRLLEQSQHARPTRSPILHWTRLAVPVPDAHGVNAASWRLIA